MKLFSAVLLSALLASQVAAGPIRFLRRASQNQNAGNSTQSQGNDDGKTKQMSPASGNTVGAAYFITNEPDGNFLVSAEIGSDGKLTLRQAVNTGGLGSHANVQNSGPDPLLSAGSVTTSAQSNIVATVNAGSNTLSIFSIDQNDPTKVTQIGQPVGSGGEFPISVAINNAGDTVCALNGGEINGIGCFKVDQKNNLVTPISQTVRSLNLKQTTPPTGPANTASQIIFSEDNSQLIASVKGTDKSNPGFLAVFDVAKDGSVSSNFQKVQPPNAQEAALFSLNVIKGKGKNAVLAADPSVGFDIFTLGGVSGNNNQSNNNAAAIQAASVPIGGQTLTTHSSFSNKIGDFFLTDIAASTLTEVNVDGNLKGSIITRLQLNKDSAPIDNSIATVGNKDFMYILSANATAIDVLSLDGQGKVTGVQRLDIAGPAQGANLKINANNLQGLATFVKK